MSPSDATPATPGPPPAGLDRSAAILQALAALACVLAVLFVALGAPSVLRTPAALGLFLLAPGAAILGRRGAEPGLVIGVSLAVDALAAQLLLWSGTWSPATATYLLALVCLPALVVHLRRGARPGSAA